MESSNTKPALHLVLLSSPSHFAPMVELGKRLVTCQNVKITIFATSFLQSAISMSRMVQSAQSANYPFDIIQLPPADISGLISHGQLGLSSVPASVRMSKPAFRSAISALQNPPTALIVHATAVDGLGIADELNIPKYVYISSNACQLALFIYAPILDKKVVGRDQLGVHKKQPFFIPGCTPIRPEDMPHPSLFRTKENYHEFIRIAVEIRKADGILVNTWEELQPKTLAALRDNKHLGSFVKAPIFPIGPVTSSAAVISESEIFTWMDKQPTQSVLFISFGSMGALSLEQMTELAWGLELSQQRFIWVVHPRTGTGLMSSYLPEGFMSRIQERGLVVPQWYRQVEILSHRSCGGFFTHCGWNSILECTTNGVPMIAWPLYAEQRMNATMLAEELGIAVRSRTIPSNGVVGRKEIETMIKKLFVDEEGRKIRSRVKYLKFSAEKAWSKSGSSYNALAVMPIAMAKVKLNAALLASPGIGNLILILELGRRIVIHHDFTMTTMQSRKPHAVLLASPGMGHLIPVLELGKRLVSHHGFTVTIFVVTTATSLSTPASKTIRNFVPRQSCSIAAGGYLRPDRSNHSNLNAACHDGA
ncbi:hypothetical protein DITRI_Ditri16bG0024600 [Diplodiscus trichospermus]